MEGRAIAQSLSRRLARFVSIGEARFGERVFLRDRPIPTPAGIGGGDVEQRHAARFRQRNRVARSGHVDGVVFLVGQIEADSRSAVDQEVVRLGDPCAPAEMRLRDIARQRLDRDVRPVIGADVAVAMDETGHPVPLPQKARADLAAQEAGGTGYEDVQQQAAGAEASDVGPVAPKGTATPQSGKTP